MEFTVRTNRVKFANFAVDLLLPLVEQRGVPLSLGHPSMESLELKINGLVVMRSQCIVHEWSTAPTAIAAGYLARRREQGAVGQLAAVQSRVV